MTEQEAKAFASELDGHKIIQVIRVFQEWPFQWTVEVARRSNPAQTGVIRAPISPSWLNEFLHKAEESNWGRLD